MCVCVHRGRDGASPRCSSRGGPAASSRCPAGNPPGAASSRWETDTGSLALCPCWSLALAGSAGCAGPSGSIYTIYSIKYTISYNVYIITDNLTHSRSFEPILVSSPQGQEYKNVPDRFDLVGSFGWSPQQQTALFCWWLILLIPFGFWCFSYG